MPTSVAEGIVLAVDQGTTGTTGVAFAEDGEPRGKGYREIAQHYPKPGWVEHDPEEIWQSVLGATSDALKAAGAAAPHGRAVGIPTQRETLVLWNRNDGRPLHRAIVWQDRRTAAECDRLREAGEGEAGRRVRGACAEPALTAP